MNNKVHSRRTVPPATFSSEEKPVIWEKTKTETAEEFNDDETIKVKLPPPPGPPEKYRVSFHDYQIPPPPCAFQPPPPLRSSSRRKDDDPFLIAYIECTKSSKKEDYIVGLKKKKKNMNINVFSSCKKTCSVVDDSIMKISQLPISRSRRESHH